MYKPGKSMREITYCKAISEGYATAMRKDPSVFVVGEGIASRGGCFGHTAGLLDGFGAKRVIDMPISEAGFTGMCTGAAACGSRAVADIMYNDFSLLAFDQIVNQAAKLRYMSAGQYAMPLTIVGVCGTTRSAGPHHSQSLYPLFMHIPGILVVVPSTAYDMKGLLASAILEDDLAVVLPHRGLLNRKGEVPEDDYTVPLGQARIVREGTGVTIVSWGLLLHQCLAAAEKLAARGIDAEVIDLRTLVPMDEETILGSVRKTGRLAVVDEGYTVCGAGAEIIARVQEQAFDYLDAPMVRINPLNTPVPFSPVLEQAFLPDAERIVQHLERLFS